LEENLALIIISFLGQKIKKITFLGLKSISMLKKKKLPKWTKKISFEIRGTSLLFSPKIKNTLTRRKLRLG